MLTSQSVITSYYHSLTGREARRIAEQGWDNRTAILIFVSEIFFYSFIKYFFRSWIMSKKKPIYTVSGNRYITLISLLHLHIISAFRISSHSFAIHSQLFFTHSHSFAFIRNPFAFGYFKHLSCVDSLFPGEQLGKKSGDC